MSRTCEHADKILALASTDAGTTPDDVADQTGMKLPAARAILSKWAKRGKLVAERIPGRVGNAKRYRVA